MAARIAVEALLRERKLDRTLTSHQPLSRPGEGDGLDVSAPLDVESLDRALAGGLPRGQVSEVVGPVSSGRTSLAWTALAAATRRGEYVALVDTFDRFDVASGAACGIDLTRLLWVRGTALSKTASTLDPEWLPGVRAVGGPGTMLERTIDRALKALNLVVQSRVCTLVVLDLIDAPATVLRRLPAATWLRVQRAIEGSDTAVVLLGSASMARSAEGRSIRTGAMGRESDGGVAPAAWSADASPVSAAAASRPATDVMWRGSHDRSRRLAGVRTRTQVGAARWPHTARTDFATTVTTAG